MKILIINGPNMNMLGIREPEIYGKTTYSELCEKVLAHAKDIEVYAEIFQSNHEGAIIDKIQEAFGKFDGIIINPAGYTHTSVAIPDAIKAVGIPAVEVHISNPDTREEFRKINYIRPVCIETVAGKGIDGYIEAMDILKNNI